MLINEANPTSQISFYNLLSKLENGEDDYFSGCLIAICASWLNRKISIVSNKYRWDSDDQNPFDIVLAHFSGTFMVTKVGKYKFLSSL